MKKCAKCGLEYDDDEACCCDCGSTAFKATDSAAENEARTDQQPGEMPPSEPKQPGYKFGPLSAADRDKDFVTLITCRTLSEADFIASRLRAAGIEAFIPDQSVMEWVGWNFNTYGYVRVQISPKDYEAAKDLLAG
jgi:predicted  nucleic acid-binding Zn-ribbon protein